MPFVFRLIFLRLRILEYIDKFNKIEIVKNQSIDNKIKRIGTMRRIQ